MSDQSNTQVTANKRTLRIVPYDAQWIDRFQQIGARLRAALGDLASRIDHIGSTAVPGLAAKDIIDLQVTVRSLDPPEPLSRAITGAGYVEWGSIGEDHVPPGSDSTPAEWQKMYFQAPPGSPPLHIHVRVDGRANQRYALLFRDYLRAHPAASEAYAAVKRQLARHNPDDWDIYYDIKDPVCDIVNVGAEEWATHTGWSPGPSDA